MSKRPDNENMKARTQPEQNHAERNAQGWCESITEIIERADNEDASEEDREAAEQEMQEGPLSLEVRSAWTVPGSELLKPAEYCLLLSTGGPALRIVGDLDRWGQPKTARMEWQDWGTPWTEYNEGEAPILDYAQRVIGEVCLD